ncbi:MAG: hypothetical protein Q9164_006101 [Protoblastenia rupestris]
MNRTSPPRLFHISSSSHAEYVPQQPKYPQEQPRWQQTPPRMAAPFRSKPPVDDNDFAVNEDPVKLDRVYEKVLGRGSDKMLTEEVKWLAVTHKSFDHGRRGYNDRLCFLGRRIVELQTSLALVHGSSIEPTHVPQDAYGREPFKHSALQGLDTLTEENRSISTNKKRIAQLGERYGLDTVMRWKPRKAPKLKESGFEVVIQQALYAIVGAVALQKGGQVANDIVRERILGPLGLHQGQ